MIEIELWSNKLTFQTEPTLFSPGWIDKGTLAMLSTIELADDEKVLDLGCGYGVVGIAAASVIGQDSVVMSDVNSIAVRTAASNAEHNGVPNVRIVESDALDNVEDADFTLILSNPPYHEEFAVPKRFIEQSFRHLQLGGRLLIVVKRLKWYQNKLTTVFGGVTVREIDGYYVLTAQKRTAGRQKPKKTKTTRKHEKKQGP